MIKKTINKIKMMLIATGNVEKNLLTKTDDVLDGSSTISQHINENTLAKQLINGELTEEVIKLRWRTYKILNEMNNKSVVKLSDDVVTTVNKTSNKNNVEKVIIDEIDDYPLEFVMLNDDIYLSKYDTIKQITNNEIVKPEKPLIIERNSLPKFEIENYVTKVNVRTISTDKKMIEFCVSKYPNEYNVLTRMVINELNKIKNGWINDVLMFDKIWFITDKCIGENPNKLYEYSLDKFDKIIEFDGYFVIKYICNVEVGGLDIFEQYIDTELEEKYLKKENKNF